MQLARSLVEARHRRTRTTIPLSSPHTLSVVTAATPSRCANAKHARSPSESPALVAGQSLHLLTS